MIEPDLCGDALLDEIRATLPRPGELAIWWLGQSGFLIKSAYASVLVDPYLSEHLTKKYEGTARPHVRMTRAPVRGGMLHRIDFVLASHRHSDHMDPGTLPDLMTSSNQAKLLLSESLMDHAVDLGLPKERMIGLVAGQVYHDPRISIRAIPSAHEGLDTDASGRHLYLGFVIEIEGFRLYHSGDTLAYDGLAEAIGLDRLDVMFLPINGRDPARGVAGNMSASEAVDLANRLRPRYVVPHHYDMFTFNTVPVSDFESQTLRLADGIGARVLRCSERWEIFR